MARFFLTSLMLAFLVSNAAAADAPLEELRKLMKTAGSEIMVGKTDTMIAHIHPALIALVGGDEKAKAALPKMMRADIEMIEEMGFKITSFEAGEPENVRVEGDQTFVLIPTTLVAEGEKGKFTAKSHTLGIWKAGDAAKWHLLRLGLPEARVRKMIPGLPADFTWPAKQPPKFEKRQ